LETGVTISRTFDVNLIKSIMFCMWKDVTEEGHLMEHYEPNLQRTIWLIINKDGVFVGLLALDYVSRVCLRAHPMIFPKYRKNAFVLLRESIRWYLDLCSSAPYRKIIAEVPSYKRNICIFVRKLGFVQEGVRTKSYLKNGILGDVTLFGATNNQLIRRLNHG